MSTDDAWEVAARVCGMTETDLARHVATHYRLGVADVEAVQPQALKLVPEKVAHRYQVFPLREDDRHLIVATSDPTDLDAEQALGFISGRTPVFEVVPPGALREAIDACYTPDRVVESLLDHVDADRAQGVHVVDAAGPEAVGAAEAHAAPVIAVSNLILRDAVAKGASDIHIEPDRAGGVVRFRIDGMLRHYMRMPIPALNRVISRIKIIGDLDIADRLRPQDGRAGIRVEGRKYDLRISTVPLRGSEKAVIRVLDPEATRKLEDVRIPPHELQRLRRLLTHRHGIVIVTGPTGSGKTTTLYAALSEIATGEVNVMTVEDPVEYDLPGIAQIQIEPRRDVTFASALRAILRQDPDVILVGEIRDPETAEVAVQAAMTGHLVLTTLHTNDAVSSVARLVDIGLDRSSIAETLRGVLAQRLVRLVCASCAQGVQGVQPAGRAVGCEACEQIGYRGRVPVLEVLVMTEQLEELIGKGASGAELEREAISAGMRPMREVALELVRSGETTLEEIERVLGDVGDEPEARSSEPHILLVDDDAVTRTHARVLLEKNGFQVSEVEDGVAALERISAGQDYALMVLDLEMPGMGGREVLGHLRGSVATAGLPVIVLTGSQGVAGEVQLMEEGADDYILKPIDPPRFLARIKAAVRRAST